MTIPKLFLSAVVALAVGAAVAAFGGSGKVLSLLTQAVIYAVFAIGVGLLLTLMVYGALRAISRKRLMLDHE